MIAFASYVESSGEDFSQSFADWLKVGFDLHCFTSDVNGMGQARTEISKYVKYQSASSLDRRDYYTLQPNQIPSQVIWLTP